MQKYLQRFFAKIFYHANNNNWFLEKKYLGRDYQEQFANFLSAQKQDSANFYHEFKDISLTRQMIYFSQSIALDSVLIIPHEKISFDKPGYKSVFVFFHGRGEYYEARFRDMAIQAKETGSAVLGFNPKGLRSSQGKTEKLSDIVEDGICVVKFLLEEKGFHHKQIIFQGNSMGGGVQEMVSEYFSKKYGFKFRQINSNSFRNLAAVFACYYHVPLLEKFLSSILKYANWEIKVNDDFYTTGPHRMVLKRHNDRTILPKAEFYSKLDIEADCLNCPLGYKATNRFLYDNCLLVYNGNSKTDPHFLSLNQFVVHDKYSQEVFSVYKLINKYLEESIKYL